LCQTHCKLGREIYGFLIFCLDHSHIVGTFGNVTPLGTP
jgi:hypothetical protein